MKLLSLILQNFKSFQGTHVISLPTTPGVIYCGGENHVDPLGSNGAGKSSLWEAWCWAWYGRTPRNLRASGIEPWGHEGEPCSVEVEWEVRGRRYHLFRGRNPVALALDGVTVEQQKVDEVLQLSLTEFTHLFLLGQGVPLFFDLSPAQKMEVVQEVLDLSVWVERAKRAETTAKTILEDCTRCEQKRAVCQGQLQEILEQMEEYQKAATVWSTQQREKIRQAVLEVKEAKQDYKQAAQAVRKLRKTIQQAVLGDEVSLQRVQDKLLPLNDERAHLHTLIQGCNDKIQDYKNSIDGLQELGHGECPTCYQPISTKHRARCIQQWEKAIAAQEVSERKYRRSQGDVERLRELLSKKIKKLTQDMEQARLAREAQQRELIQAQGTEQWQTERLARCEKYLIAVRGEENTWEQALQRIRERQQEVRGQLDEHDKVVAQLRKRYDATKYWTKGFREIRLVLLEESLQLLEMEVNTAMASMGLGRWAIRFDVEKEKADGGVTKGFHVMITPPDAQVPVPWESYSGGESQRLRLAGRMGVASLIASRKGIAPGVEIFDEPMAGLSAEGIEDVLEFLRNRAERMQIPLFIVDHRTLDLAGFAEHWLVVKDARGSRVIRTGGDGGE